MLATRLMGASSGVSGLQFVGGYAQGFAGTTSDVTITLASLTGGLASAAAAGDLVIVYYLVSGSVDRNLVVSGYTEVVELYVNNLYDTNLAVAYKFMGGTPDASFVLTGGSFDTGAAGAAAVQVWRGVNTTTPLDVTQTTATGTASVLCNPPAITPTTNGAIIVSGGAGVHNSVSVGTFSSADLTNFISAEGKDGSDATIGLGYKVWTSGSFDPAAFTFSTADSGSASWAAVTLALRPK